jgi:hypothetical protein
MARLGLDSKEFQAGIATAKGSVGGFQKTIESSTNSMRKIFDVALKPIAVVTAAVIMLRKAFDVLDEFVNRAADNLRAIATGNTIAVVDSLRVSVDLLRESYKRLGSEQALMAKRDLDAIATKSDLEKAQLRLQRAQALAAVPAGDTARADIINRDFEAKEKELELAQKIATMERQAESKRQGATQKSGRAFDIEAQIKDAENAEARARKNAEFMRQQAADLYNQGTARQKANAITGAILLQEDQYAKQYQKRTQAAEKADAAAKQALEVSKRLRDERAQLERESLAEMEEARNIEKRIETERTTEQAKQLEQRNKDAINAAAKLADNERAAAEIRMGAKEAEREKADRDADRLGRIRGRGIEADSMARVGGFLGGERPQLAVADKQLQVAKEQLVIEKENRKLNERIANALERAYGGGEGV